MMLRCMLSQVSAPEVVADLPPRGRLQLDGCEGVGTHPRSKSAPPARHDGS
jgi:hypothetical protein